MKKRKWTFWNIVCFTGLPWCAITFAVGILIEKQWYESKRRDVFAINSIDDIWEVLCVTAVIGILVLLKNCMWIGTDKKIGLFTWMLKYRDEPKEVSDSKLKAQYPKVDKEYLSFEPNQFPLGKQGDKFVQFNIDSCLSILVFGSPGAGKTTLLLTMILYQIHKKKNSGNAPVLFVFDFKEGEMYRKSCRPDSSKELFVSLSGRKYWGWDPYYRLKDNPSDDDIIRELTSIANIIIDGANEKNAFFTDSARIILIFVGLLDFRKGKSFIETIDHITRGDTKSMLNSAMDCCEGNPNFQKVKDAIAEYVSINDENEALNNIKMTLKQRMSVFKVDDIRWALEYNPRKASPFDLERGKSIFFYPGDTDVTDVVLKIIAKQLEYHCRHRDFMNLKGHRELRKIITVADECYTIGNVVDFANWASVARAFNNTLIMIWQSYSQIKETYNESIAESLLDDVAGTAVLAVNSPKNAEQFVDFAGEYLEEKKTYSHGGTNDGTYSRSYESKPILTKKDFLQLRKKKEVILLMDGDYYRVQSEPARYYMIPELNRISEQCLKEQRKREQNKPYGGDSHAGGKKNQRVRRKSN